MQSEKGKSQQSIQITVHIFSFFCIVPFLRYVTYCNTPPFKVYYSVVLVVTELFNHHYHQIPEHLHHPKKKACIHQQHSPFFPFPQLLTNSNVPFVCTDLYTLDISCKLNQYSFMILQQNSINGSFLKVSCNVEPETISILCYYKANFIVSFEL